MKDLYSPHDMIRSGLCIGCGTCVQNSGAKMQFDPFGQLKPQGDKEWMHTPTTHLSYTCPFSPLAKNEDQLADIFFPGSNHRDPYAGRFQSAWVGYAAEADMRMQASSGGMATWVATELLRRGLIDGVAHVVASEDPQQDKRFFHYRISRTEEEVRQGAKSRYYPIELSQVLKTIREVPGRYAVVGIPCFIKSIQLLRDEDPLMRERIRFTLGLFCGHMKSARFVESFAWQMGVNIQDVSKVEFRYKNADRPANWYTAMLQLRDGTTITKDWWHLADGDWGAGFFMNKACNYCDDVISETADVSFGDAWVEPYASDGKGTNVMVVRSREIENIIHEGINEGKLQLQEVDAAFVHQTQAAGFRQRREGLAYRLAWAKPGIDVKKRVAPDKEAVTKERKRIYRLRYHVSKWSHRFFRLARSMKKPGIYLRWARMATALYFGLAYHRGKLAEMKQRLRSLKN